MTRLWIVYTVILLVCLFYSMGEQTQKRQCIVAVTIIMTLFSGLRSWWYGDLIKYYTRFITESDLTFREIFHNNGLRNFGLTIINKWAYSIFGIYGYEILLFCIALFAAYTLGKVIDAYSPSAYWSYLMYLSMGFYTFTFSGLKQTIAMGFCCLAMIALLQDDLKKFLILVGLGALFHTPALTFLVAYPFSRKKFDEWYVVFVTAILAIMYLYRDNIAYFLEDAYHSDEAAEAVLVKNVSGVGGRFIAMLLIMLLAMMLRPLTTKDKSYVKVFNVMVLAAAIQMMSVFNNTYSRLADYFYQFVVLFVPMFMAPITSRKEAAYRRVSSIIQNNDTRLILVVGITLFSIWFYSTQISDVEYYGAILFFWEKNAYLLYGQ